MQRGLTVFIPLFDQPGILAQVRGHAVGPTQRRGHENRFPRTVLLEQGHHVGVTPGGSPKNGRHPPIATMNIGAMIQEHFRYGHVASGSHGEQRTEQIHIRAAILQRPRLIDVHARGDQLLELGRVGPAHCRPEFPEPSQVSRFHAGAAHFSVNPS
jgi:hypothetical protein